jgi:protein-disulfide isomerase
MLLRDYVDTGKLQYVFLNYPLDAIHSDARRLALAGVCANQQDKFWSFHRLILGHKGTTAPVLSNGSLQSVGLATDVLKACMDKPETAAKVRSQVNVARDLGLTSTPSFLVTRRDTGTIAQVAAVITGAQPADAFKKAIDELLFAQTRNDK